MHRRFHHFHRFCAAFAVAVLSLAVACSSNGDEDPTADPRGAEPIANETAVAGDVQPSSRSPAARQPWPEGQPVEQSQWVKDRLAAMKQIFRFTPAGEAWIDGYDFRQMAEQPAWFGSFGYSSWAGAGEAVPRSVLHEISHSYWGAFSVDGEPDLSWDVSGGVAPALAEFREDLRIFMLQPPDRFEPLRDRFRNLPGLSTGDYPDLHHFGEADLLYMAGGNLQLIPPILQPYFEGYLAEGGVGDGDGSSPEAWDEAIAWFNSLSGEDRRIAGEVFGLQHFPHAPYAGLPDSELVGIDPVVAALYEGEERQRLIDFEQQFEGILEREFSLLDAAGADRGFDFWRSYLSDKLDLHRRYPDVLTGIGTGRGAELANALDFYGSISGLSPEDQVERFRESEQQPLVPELAVLLRPRAIVELFSDPATEGGIASVLGSRADRLTSLVEAADQVASAFTTEMWGPAAAALGLEIFIRSLPEDQFRADAFLLRDLLRSAESGLTEAVLPRLSDETLQFILRVQPAFARSSEIGPERLLAAVGITGNASLQQIGAGAALLSANSSGNFAIDAAYDSAVFEHLDYFVESVPAEVLETVTESGMRLVPWIDRESDGALRTFEAAPAVAAQMLVEMDGVRETRWRIIHLVAKDDPELAAELTVELELAAEGPETVNLTGRVIARAIREFGYDLYWSERNAGPNVEPERFADYLLALIELVGEERFVSAMSQVFEDYRFAPSIGLIEHDAGVEFIRTVEAAIATESGQDAIRLEELVKSSVGFS